MKRGYGDYIYIHENFVAVDYVERRRADSCLFRNKRDRETIQPIGVRTLADIHLKRQVELRGLVTFHTRTVTNTRGDP